MEPRIYTYKITWPYQGWFYWGVHKEQVYGEPYYGSPVTHKDKWGNFEHEIQILECFDYSESGWREAQEIEKRLIAPDLNNPMCLNENIGGIMSLQALSKGGKISGRNNVESGHLGSIASKGGKIMGPIQGRKNVESGQLASISTFENRSKGGKAAVESGQLASICSKGGKAAGKIAVESGQLAKVRSYLYRCLITNHVTTAGPLTNYQRARGIDPKQRIRVK